jgi:hypothetical protein
MQFFGYMLGEPSAPMSPPTPEGYAELGEFAKETSAAASHCEPAACPGGSR